LPDRHREFKRNRKFDPERHRKFEWDHKQFKVFLKFFVKIIFGYPILKPERVKNSDRKG